MLCPCFIHRRRSTPSAFYIIPFTRTQCHTGCIPSTEHPCDLCTIAHTHGLRTIHTRWVRTSIPCSVHKQFRRCDRPRHLATCNKHKWLIRLVTCSVGTMLGACRHGISKSVDPTCGDCDPCAASLFRTTAQCTRKLKDPSGDNDATSSVGNSSTVSNGNGEVSNMFPLPIVLSCDVAKNVDAGITDIVASGTCVSTNCIAS